MTPFDVTVYRTDEWAKGAGESKRHTYTNVLYPPITLANHDTLIITTDGNFILPVGTVLDYQFSFWGGKSLGGTTNQSQPVYAGRDR